MNRRSVLGMTATTAIGFALSPARIFAQASGPGPEMSALSTYMSAAGTRALPVEASEHAKHHLLDTLASMISGSELLPGQAALRHIRSHAGKGTATIAGSALTAAPVDAALALHEGLEDARKQRWSDADPVVLHLDARVRALLHRPHRDVPSGRRVLRGIGEQVGHHLAQARRIGSCMMPVSRPLSQ